MLPSRRYAAHATCQGYRLAPHPPNRSSTAPSLRGVRRPTPPAVERGPYAVADRASYGSVARSLATGSSAGWRGGG